MNETMTAEQAASKLTNIMHDDHYAWHPSVLEAFRMAVDALKSADGDCISRAAAIKALCKAGCNSGFCGVSCDDVKAIEDLPSFPQRHENDAYYDGYDNGYNAGFEAGQRDVLLEKTQLSREDTTSDCISRQAAIYEIRRCRFVVDAIEKISGLPSAQPEQRWIPCGKCIHADGKHRWCKVLDRTINEDYFCCWAEPRKEGKAE